MVNRFTFYLHFKDKYEIAEKLQTYYVDELKRTLNDIHSSNKG
jgi:AcrR family transcriptional regulator